MPLIIQNTRSCAALRAADLDWIVGLGYSLGRVYSFAKYYVLDRGGGQGRNKQKRYKQTLSVTDAGTQLTF